MADPNLLLVPLRTKGTDWDVGEALWFLAGERSRWGSGTTLTVDGDFSPDLRMSTVIHSLKQLIRRPQASMVG